MTRGVIITKKGKEYLSLGYSNSDSYPSGDIGKMLVQALSANADEETVGIINTYIEGLDRKDSLDCWMTLAELGEAFYKKDEFNARDYFYDYAYVYDTKARSLKIYRFGELTYTFKKSDVRYLKMLVENDEQLWPAFSYDNRVKDTVGGNRDVKAIKKLIREGKTPEEILDIANKLTEDIHYRLSSGRIVDCWKNSYAKEVTLFPSGGKLKFILDEAWENSWSVYLQLPWIRDRIIPTAYKSESAAIKGLIRFLDENWASLQNGLPLYALYDECHKKLMDFYNGCDKLSISKEEFDAAIAPIVREFEEKISAYADADLTGYRGGLSADKAKKGIELWVNHAHRHIFEILQVA